MLLLLLKDCNSKHIKLFCQLVVLIFKIFSRYCREFLWKLDDSIIFFQNNPCQHPVIILKEVNSEDLLSVISFIYEGEVNVNHKRLHTFMKLAETLQVRGLTESSSTSSSKELPVSLSKKVSNFHG